MAAEAAIRLPLSSLVARRSAASTFFLIEGLHVQLCIVLYSFITCYVGFIRKTQPPAEADSGTLGYWDH